MDALADRLKNVHPNARKNVRSDAMYVSDGLQEYTIDRQPDGYYKVTRYRGGATRSDIKSCYTSFVEAEKALFNLLIKTNKFGRAIWRGQKLTNFIERS